MNCRKIERLLTENMESATRADLSRHLEQCERCRELYRELKALAELSGELKSESEAPAFFATRVYARANGPVRSRRSLAFGVVAASAVVFFSFSLLRFVSFEDQPAQEAGPSVVSTELPVQDWQSEPIWNAYESISDGIVAGKADRDARFVEILVSEPSESDYIVRLPSTIEVRNTQAENEYYLRNVSH